MTRSLLVNTLIAPFLWVVFTLPAHSGSVEFAQWIPWNFISQELRKNELLLDLTEEKITLSLGELRPVLKDVKFSSRTMVQEFTHKKGSLLLSGAGSLGVHFGAISIHQVIQREFGGNIVEIELKAECSAAEIEVSSFSLQSDFDLNENSGSLPGLRDISLNIHPGDWKITPVTCTGLGGIAEEIEHSLESAMKDPASLAVLLKNWMKPYLDQWIKAQWLTVSHSRNLRIVSPGENGFYLKGELPLLSHEDIVLKDILPSDPELSTPRFYLSREGWMALAGDNLRSFIPKYYDLRENESFRKLMRSRFLQLLVWPHLRKFPSSTPFVLKIDPRTLVLQLSQNKNEWIAGVSGNGSLTTLIGNSPIDYLVLGLKLSIPFKMSVEAGNLILNSSETHATIDWKFGYLYQLLYLPDKKIPVQIMTSALSGLTSNRKQILKLPVFRISDKEYVLGNLRIEDQLLTMDWL